MPKGHTNNPNGRPKGSKNRDKLREAVEQICRENSATMKHDLEQLEPKDRLIVLTRLLAFVLPKPEPDQAVDIASKLLEPQTITFEF